MAQSFGDIKTNYDAVEVKKETTETIGTAAFNNFLTGITNAGFFKTPAKANEKIESVYPNVLFPCQAKTNYVQNNLVYNYNRNNDDPFPFASGISNGVNGAQYTDAYFLSFFPRLYPVLTTPYDFITNILKNGETLRYVNAWEVNLITGTRAGGSTIKYEYPFGWNYTLLGGISELFQKYPNGKVLSEYRMYTNKTDDSSQDLLYSINYTETGTTSSGTQVGTRMIYRYTDDASTYKYGLVDYIGSALIDHTSYNVANDSYISLDSCLSKTQGCGWISESKDFHLIVLSYGSNAPENKPFIPTRYETYGSTDQRLTKSVGPGPVISFLVADQPAWERFFNGSAMPWSYDLATIISPTSNGKPNPGINQPDTKKDPGQPSDPTNPPGTGDGDNNSDKIEFPDPSFVPNGAYYRYWLSAEDIPNLRNFLFDQSFIDDVRRLWSDPINYIVDITYYPLIPSALNAVGGSQKISIGGVQSEVVAEIMPGNSKPYLFGGYYDIKEYYGNYLDYEPYTSLSIFLPYIGTRELDVSRVTGHRIGVWYLFDFDSRIITAQLVLDGGDGSSRGGTVYCDFSAPFGITYPLSGASMNERALAIVNSVTSTAVIAGGVVAGAALPATTSTIGQIATTTGKSILAAGKSALESSRNMVSPKMGGTMSPMSGLFGPQIPYLIINRPITSLPSTYNTDHGLSAAYSGKVSDFASDSFLRCSDVILDVAPDMTVDEQNEIISLLQSGVYI